MNSLVGILLIILENIVYIEFLRHGYDVSVGRIKNYEIDFSVEDIKKIANKKPEKLISSIYLLLNNFELEVDELIEICEKYNIDKSNFTSYYFSEQFKILKKQSNNQIFIDFYDEEREVA